MFYYLIDSYIEADFKCMPRKRDRTEKLFFRAGNRMFRTINYMITR